MAATQTQTRQQAPQGDQQQQSNRPAALEPSRLPISPAVAKEFEIGPTEWRVLVDQLYPAARTVEAIMMALAYCRKRDLDIFKKPVHIVPMWSSAKRAMVETVWPGIAEIRTTAARTGQYAGIDAVEFGPMIERSFTGEMEVWENRQQVMRRVTKTVTYPEWASVVVYRLTAGTPFAYHAKVFWEETYATVGKSELPNDMWNKRPRGQIDKCVEAAALRKAFPEELGNIYAAEEMEGRDLDSVTIDHEAAAPPRSPAPRPPRPNQPPAEEQPRQQERQAPRDEPPETTADDDAGATIDGEIVDQGDERDKAADFAFFDELRERLAEANDIETAEEIWTEMDPIARFEGDDDGQRLCENIKARRLQQIEKERERKQ